MSQFAAEFKGPEQLQSIGKELNRQHHEGKSKENFNRRLRIAEVFGLWIAAIVGLIAVFVANGDAARQVNVIQRQLDEARDEQRSWLEIPKITMRPDASFDPKTGIFHLSLDLKNVGHLPAYASVNAVIIRQIADSDTWRAKQKSVCDEPVERNQIEFIVFPATSPFPYFVERRISIPTSNKLSYTPLIIGCVIYSEYSDKTQHRTPFYALISHEDSTAKEASVRGRIEPMPAGDAIIPDQMLTVKDLSMAGEAN